LRGIALFEAIKGLGAVLSGLGLIGLLHHDLRHLVLELVGHFNLDPHQHFPVLMLHYVDVLNNTPIGSLELLLAGYATLRSAEAYGLWNDKAWAEWMGAASGGLYIPFELRHLWHETTLLSAAMLGLNLLVVAFLVLQLRRRHALAGTTNANP
jgi:uncharacterized membrane protein (DUF2068 family)